MAIGDPDVASLPRIESLGVKNFPFSFLDFRKGEGEATSGELPDEEDQRVNH